MTLSHTTTTTICAKLKAVGEMEVMLLSANIEIICEKLIRVIFYIATLRENHKFACTPTIISFANQIIILQTSLLTLKFMSNTLVYYSLF